MDWARAVAEEPKVMVLAAVALVRQPDGQTAVISTWATESGGVPAMLLPELMRAELEHCVSGKMIRSAILDVLGYEDPDPGGAA